MAYRHPDVPQITWRQGQDGSMPTPAGGAPEPLDPSRERSSDDRDLGWGGRDWTDSDGGAEEADLERLRTDRPPHHEERER